jgi:hypothetical protein
LNYGFTKSSPFSKSETSNINSLKEKGKFTTTDKWVFSNNISGILYNKAEFFIGKNGSPFIKPLPKKRMEMMQLFNDCAPAMVKYRDVPDKKFDFIQFLNFYNVECVDN